MGGPGSGQWCRWSTKATAEQLNRVDIRYMHSKGLLKSFRTGSLSWTCGSESAGHINYSCFADHLVLNYRYRENGGDWIPIAEKVLFDTTNCFFGGERKWLLCPNCSRRCAVLYAGGPRFLCRYCYGISYRTQNVDWIDRLIEKRRKIEKRLFGDYRYRRKKGMHQATYERLFKEFSRIDGAIDREIDRRLNNGL